MSRNSLEDTYDPFVRGRFPVGVRTIQATDTARDRCFPCEIWYPAAATEAGGDSASEIRNAPSLPGTWPLILFSHHSGGHRRAATFLCTHLSSHGYVVAALDHSEVVAKELARRDGETAAQKTARMEVWIASRVPDMRFLLDYLLDHTETKVDDGAIGIVGHSFGGWTALAAPDVESRIRAVVALAPGGSSQPRPGIIPVKLPFRRGRDVPTLYLAAEQDISILLAGLYELFERTPATKQMVILRRADHLHFIDNVEQQYEAMRGMQFTGELAWITKEMRPMAELCSGEQAHLFVRGLTLCHLDATLRGQAEARRFLAGDIEGELARRGVDGWVHRQFPLTPSLPPV